MVADEENVDGEEVEGVEVVDPPNVPPPPPPVAPQPLAPSQLPPGRRRGSPDQPRCWNRGCVGDHPIFSSPVHSHMTVMRILHRAIRCLIRRNEGGRRGWVRMPLGGGLGVETPPWCPPRPHASDHQCGQFAGTEFVVRPPRYPFSNGALRGAATALDQAWLGQAVVARQGRRVRGRLGHCPGPAPTHLRSGVSALVRGPHPKLPQREGALGGRERGQAGGPNGPSSRRGSPHCGPYRSVSLPTCYEGSGRNRHQCYA